LKVTINDIAKISGVSKATVSRVVNGTKPVSDEVRRKVMQAIDETGYKPSSLARSLMTKETKLIGVVIPDVSNPIFSQLVKGMEEVSSEQGYNILLCNSYLNHDKEMEYLEILSDKEVDGIVFLTTKETKAHSDFFNEYKKPVVTVDRSFKNIDIPSVSIDDFEASQKAVNYLINLGHKNIGMVRASLDDRAHGLHRFEGYKVALENAGLCIREENVVEGDFSVQSGYDAVSKILSNNTPPTAIFFANDTMAVGGIRCITDSGLRVPDDISVIGFDDIPISEMFIPSLSTIKQPTMTVGRSAMEKLLKLIKNEPIEMHTLFETQLIQRNSSKRI